MGSLGALKKDIAKFKNRKRKVVSSIKSRGSEPKKAKKVKRRGFYI